METINATSKDTQHKIELSKQDYLDLCSKLSNLVRERENDFDNIFAIPRGGYFAAIFLSKQLQKPLILEESEITDRTLIVDDIIDSGKTMQMYAKSKYMLTACVIARRSEQCTFSALITDKWVLFPNEKHNGIEQNITRILQYIGEDPNREGLKDTPKRIAKMYYEIFRGYNASQKPKITTFENDMKSTDIVFDSGDFYSMCEHHMLPFLGKYYFAYIPKEDGKILGISKIARVVGYCAAKLQLQERLAREVVTMLSSAIDNYCEGMAIVMRASHLCKSMRGVKNSGEMTVAHLSGAFKNDENARREFYKLIEITK